MPALDPEYFPKRDAEGHGLWSGDRWLDVEHATVLKRALRRIWPEYGRGTALLDVGCGDGRWTRWMGREFDCVANATDIAEFARVRYRVDRFKEADGEDLTPILNSWGRFRVVTSINALTCYADWRKAAAELRRLSSQYVIVFDNFQTPTPPWAKGSKYRQPIEWPELKADFEEAGWYLAKWVAGDWWHRKLFLKTPAVLHPAVSLVTAGLDWWAAWTVDVRKARHMALLFERKM